MIKYSNVTLFTENEHSMRLVKAAYPSSMLQDISTGGYYATGDVLLETWKLDGERPSSCAFIVYKYKPGYAQTVFAPYSGAVEYPDYYLLYRAGICCDRVDKDTLIIRRI